MDFIKYISELQGYTNILIVVDKLTKQVVFIPTLNSIDAIGLTDLFV